AIAGKGIGKNLMLFSEEIATQHKKQGIFLKAMDTSNDALIFYEKMGYTKCGTLVLPFEQMKEEYRGMIILNKLL
ncbi:MAG: GNAT family N-acetyltransferase, partial [Sediminibacterium sp.]